MTQRGQVVRKDKQKAIVELKKLGIAEGSQIYDFFLEFKPGTFLSTSSYEELMDIAEPSPEITLGTNFIHEVWEIPEEYICLTSCEGEGCYLYSKNTEAVYDFSLAEREQFISNPIPSWGSFFEFIEWYLAPAVVK